MKKIFVFSIFAFLILLGSNTSYGCSCLFTKGSPKSLVNKAQKEASVVFSGEIVEEIKSSGYERIFRFKIEKNFKGKQTSEIKISTGRGGGDCGYGFEVGKKYLVYAYGKDDNFSTGICSRTGLLEKNEDLKYLKRRKN